MRILVTGGLGFVGSCLTPRLLQDPRCKQLTVIDKLCYTAIPERLAEYQQSPKFRFVKGDITDPTIMDELVAAADLVIHLAAETFVDKSIQGSRLFWEVNVMGTHNVVEACRRHQPQKLLHISTDEVWGHALGATRFTEQSRYRPRNPYAASKAAADHMVRAAATTYHLPYTIIHLTNLYGPFQYPEKLIPKSIINLMAGNKISVYGNGLQEREWMHVEDAVSGILAALWHAPAGESYALGSGQCLTNLGVLTMLLAHMGRSEADLEFVADRPGHDQRYAVDSTKAQTQLGWTATRELQRELPALIQWYQRHTDWLEQRT